MKAIDRFDPFNDRLCRNVRNALSENFKEGMEKRDLQPVRRVAGFFMKDQPPACVAAYIDQRLTAYEAVLTDISSRTLEDPLDIALSLWDHRLFFETHEYLEFWWMAATGDEKRFFQAMIRAAGAYVHLEQGNLTGARRIAGKAIDGLKGCMERLASHANPQLLLDKLEALDPEPPTLSGTAR
jgi:hypothetical protein